MESNKAPLTTEQLFMDQNPKLSGGLEPWSFMFPDSWDDDPI
jgi:hypothetical protein